MKRLVDHYLRQWKDELERKPLLLRGARQVGKTYSVRELGATFPTFVEVNFEYQPIAKEIFEQDLSPERIIRDLSILMERTITPGETLLFLDEVQQAPNALTALRYFHERMPDLHVVAAGSLLDFVLDKVGLPVGRISSYHLYPLTFVEFLHSTGRPMHASAMLELTPERPLGLAVHEQLLTFLAEYLAVGGMPAAVASWAKFRDVNRCARIHQDIVESYRQDFGRYTTKYNIKHVELLFNEVPARLGGKLKFSILPGAYRRRELEPALEMLVKAGVVHKVVRTAGAGVPLGVNADTETFKVVFLDCALAQCVLNLEPGPWLLDAQSTVVNRGAIAESFVGQEMLALMPSYTKGRLYYWHREARSSNAEVDYLMQIGSAVIPIEVKSGRGGHLKSMHLFLNEHATAPYGIRFCAAPASVHERIRTYPLYAVAPAMNISHESLHYLK